MKVAFVFLAFLEVIFAGPAPEINDSGVSSQEFKYYKSDEGANAVEDLSQGTIEAYATESDLTYYFFSRRHSDGVALKRSDVAQIKTRTDYNINKRTFFIIHGWTQSHEASLNTEVTNAALSLEDVNVFVVDWSPISRQIYSRAQASVLQVGNFVGDFINQLHLRFHQPYETITIVGLSLGGQIAGNAGAATGGRVGTLVGLDPAGPDFTVENIHNRIDPTDGRHVIIIHTNGGQLGFGSNMGHVDYYPNGGRRQPGCGLDLTGLCAHGRAYIYYVESLTNNRFLSRNCDTYNDFILYRCRTRSTSLMGGMFLDTSDRGEFYLTTNNESPFARGTA